MRWRKMTEDSEKGEGRWDVEKHGWGEWMRRGGGGAAFRRRGKDGLRAPPRLALFYIALTAITCPSPARPARRLLPPAQAPNQI